MGPQAAITITGVCGVALLAVINRSASYRWNGCCMAGERDGAGDLYNSQVCVPAPTLPATASAQMDLLQISDDISLGRTREAILLRAGLQVLTIFSSQVADLARPERPVMVLFCQSVRTDLAEQLIVHLREHLGILCTVRLSRDPSSESHCFDHVFLAPVAPQLLMREASYWKDACRSIDRV